MWCIVNTCVNWTVTRVQARHVTHRGPFIVKSLYTPRTIHNPWLCHSSNGCSNPVGVVFESGKRISISTPRWYSNGTSSFSAEVLLYCKPSSQIVHRRFQLRNDTASYYFFFLVTLYFRFFYSTSCHSWILHFFHLIVKFVKNLNNLQLWFKTVDQFSCLFSKILISAHHSVAVIRSSFIENVFRRFLSPGRNAAHSDPNLRQCEFRSANEWSLSWSWDHPRHLRWMLSRRRYSWTNTSLTFQDHQHVSCHGLEAEYFTRPTIACRFARRNFNIARKKASYETVSVGKCLANTEWNSWNVYCLTNNNNGI